MKKEQVKRERGNNQEAAATPTTVTPVPVVESDAVPHASIEVDQVAARQSEGPGALANGAQQELDSAAIKQAESATPADDGAVADEEVSICSFIGLRQALTLS